MAVSFMVEALALECLVDKLGALSNNVHGVLDHSWMVSPITLSVESFAETQWVT